MTLDTETVNPAPPGPVPSARLVARPLSDLAWARSGDKGDIANIGVIARSERLLPWIWAALTPGMVARVFETVTEDRVERFYLPGSHAMNLVLHGALGGGGIASLHNDPQAKGFAQRLLTLPVPVPETLVAEGHSDAV